VAAQPAAAVRDRPVTCSRKAGAQMSTQNSMAQASASADQ
jgi:hypothetical protein